LYASIPRSIRINLYRTLFLALRQTDTDTEALAEYAFEARMFLEAGNYYRELVARATRSDQARVALSHYDRLQQCLKGSGDALGVNDVLGIARCLERTGKHRAAENLYKRLLSDAGVQSTPQFLSRIYVRLAESARRISPEERVRLLEIALQALPE